MTSRAGKKRICKQKQKYRQSNDNGKKRKNAGINMREAVYKALKVGWDYIKILLGNVVQILSNAILNNGIYVMKGVYQWQCRRRTGGK